MNKRELEITRLAQLVQEKVQKVLGGCLCLVPSSDGSKMYKVNIDENYKAISCDCRGGRYECKHKKAVEVYFAPALADLLSDLNPVYGLYRKNTYVKARLSQFSNAERRALKLFIQATRRAAYNEIFDPNMVA